MNSHECFNIIYNVSDLCAGKKIKELDQECFYFNRKTTQRMIPKVENICRQINSSHFGKKDLIFYLLTVAMQKGRFGILSFNSNHIKKTVKLFSVAQTKADHKFINDLMEENRITLDDMIKVKEDGQSLIYELFRKNYITVCLILKYSRKLLIPLTSPSPDVILNTDYKNFLKVLQTTKSFISTTGAQNEQ